MEVEDKLLSVIRDSEFHNDKQQQELFLEKLFESARQLNPAIIEPFIDEEDVFVDGTKYRFLNNLKKTYNIHGHRTKMEIVEEGDYGCLGQSSCKFKDGTPTRGMKVRGFRYFGAYHKSVFNVELKRKKLATIGFVLRYDKEGYLIDVMLCAYIKKLRNP